MRNVIEIERRWLMKGLPNETHQLFSKLGICQWYEESSDGTIRHRRTFNWVHQGKPLYEKIIKKPIELYPGMNVETTLDHNGSINFWSGFYTHKKICKTRFVYMPDGVFKYEIDLFDPPNNGLIIMEVELKDPLDWVTFPPWIEELIDREITGDSSYSNYNLAK